MTASHALTPLENVVPTVVETTTETGATKARIRKRMNISRALAILLAAVAVLSSCSRPLSYEVFVRQADASDGDYHFELDLSDSTGFYDLYFYTRVDRSRNLGPESRTPMKLDIWWESPSHMVYDETVYMDAGDFRGVRQIYRSGIVPAEYGIWKLCVRPSPVPVSFRGLGIILEQNGTR